MKLKVLGGYNKKGSNKYISTALNAGNVQTEESLSLVSVNQPTWNKDKTKSIKTINHALWTKTIPPSATIVDQAKWFHPDLLNFQCLPSTYMAVN